MLVSHRNKFIYTKTIKTASTSVEVYFEPYCRPDGKGTAGVRDEQISDAGIIGYRGPNRSGKRWYHHMPAKKIKEYLGAEVWSEYFKFCVIRNPFEKLVSAYHFYQWLMDRASGLEKARLVVLHGLIPSKSRDDIKRFRRWLAWTRWFNDRAQYMIDGEVCIDFFIRYESLHDDVRTVCQRLGIPHDPERMPQLKSQINPRDRDLAEYYDEKSIEIVRRRFQFELQHFGYDVPF